VVIFKLLKESFDFLLSIQIIDNLTKKLAPVNNADLKKLNLEPRLLKIFDGQILFHDFFFFFDENANLSNLFTKSVA